MRKTKRVESGRSSPQCSDGDDRADEREELSLDALARVSGGFPPWYVVVQFNLATTRAAITYSTDGPDPVSDPGGRLMWDMFRGGVAGMQSGWQGIAVGSFYGMMNSPAMGNFKNPGFIAPGNNSGTQGAPGISDWMHPPEPQTAQQPATQNPPDPQDMGGYGAEQIPTEWGQAPQDRISGSFEDLGRDPNNYGYGNPNEVASDPGTGASETWDGGGGGGNQRASESVDPSSSGGEQTASDGGDAGSSSGGDVGGGAGLEQYGGEGFF